MLGYQTAVAAYLVLDAQCPQGRPVGGDVDADQRFAMLAFDGLDVLMQGSHDRFVVNNAQVLQRILAKRQRLQQAGAITG